MARQARPGGCRSEAAAGTSHRADRSCQRRPSLLHSSASSAISCQPFVIWSHAHAAFAECARASSILIESRARLVRTAVSTPRADLSASWGGAGKSIEMARSGKPILRCSFSLPLRPLLSLRRRRLRRSNRPAATASATSGARMKRR
eukprot:scaffold207328_cov27-Tisochrysis_lutea.AAC.1